MEIRHPQETVIETFDYKGTAVDIVEWTDTSWCGKIGYAVNNTDEPDVEAILQAFMALNVPAAAANGREDAWDVCISVNYLSPQRPKGVMFGFLVDTQRQPEGFDLYIVPAARYARLRICDETAKALGRAPWRGGIPPYEWIGMQIAPEIGYCYGDDSLPIFEYYGYYNAATRAHEYCFLYVPVEKAINPSI